MDLVGKVVVVTGAGNGIGAALARRFAAEGAATVVVTDIDGDAARSVAGEIDAEAATLDVADEATVRRVLRRVEADHGRIDLMCMNAGIAILGGVDVRNDQWRRSWDVNVMSHIYAARAVLPGMLERGDGYLLHTASAAGLLTNIGAAAYSVTKHAVVGLAEWLAVTHGDSGIKVSCLCPQFVDTAMVAEMATTPEAMAWVRGSLLSADEVAEATVAGLEQERFLILPHPEVGEFFRRKAADPEQWLEGMRRLQASLGPIAPRA